MSPVKSSGGGGSSAGNFAGTMALAVAALGLTAAMYVANWRRARRGSPDNGSKGDNSTASPTAGTSTGAGGDSTGTGAGGGAASTAATGPFGCALPQRNYYSIRAETHVRRHNANLVEWGDESLGVAVPFSPILFTVTREERQAPMVLLTLRYLRHPSHEIAIAIEELSEPQSAENYREASLSKILDCSRILSTTPVRIGNTNHPSAEYCYVDERDQMHHVMAIFLTHERLALTIQYGADIRVRNLLPTAFYELVRSIRFSQPRPTPSYLLVSEPRLGLGFRLALDFMVHEGLAEGMEGAGLGPLSATVGTNNNSSSAADLGASYGNVMLSSVFATAVGRGTRRMGLLACYEPSASVALAGGGGVGAAFARGGGSTSASNPNSSLGGSVPTSGPQWHQFLDRQMQLCVRRLAVQLGGPVRVVFREATGGGGGGAKQQASEETVLPGHVVMRPYRLSLPRRGNFGGTEEDDEYGDESGRSIVSVTGSCCLQEVRLDASSPCLQLIRDSLDQDALEENRREGGRGGKAIPENTTSPAYLGVFYVPIRDECVSFTFVASAQRHSFEEFVSWCSATMQSMSLSNHHGQNTSVLYCNLRHEILPFTLSLQPGTQTVEEPQLGDPLAVVSAYGVERTTVMLRVFPLLQVLPTSSSGTGTPANTSGGQAPRPPPPAPTSTLAAPTANPLTRAQREKQRQRTQARVLEHMLRGYLSQLPEAVRVLNWERCSVHGMAAMRFCFEHLVPQLYPIAGAGAGASGASSGSVAGGNLDDLEASSVATTEWLSSRSLVLEEEVGSMNPFSRYYPPPPPSLAYLGLRPSPPPAPAAAVAGTRRKDNHRAATPTPAAAGSHGNASIESLPGDDSVEDPLRVGMVVCAEGHAFMFISSSSVYSLAVTQQMVQELASHFALNTAAGQ